MTFENDIVIDTYDVTVDSVSKYQEENSDVRTAEVIDTSGVIEDIEVIIEGPVTKTIMLKYECQQ